MADEYIQFFEKNRTSIPHVERLINILRSDLKPGYLVQAKITKIFFESDDFKITDIEVRTNKDVDIELDGKINIQVWHGASVGSHNIRNGKVSKQGGVETNSEQDEKVIKKKLAQLPDDKPGFVICEDNCPGIDVLPEWSEKIADNKAIFQIFYSKRDNDIQPDAFLHCSKKFKHMDLAEKIASALGVAIKICIYEVSE